MQLINLVKVDMADYNKTATADVFYVHIKLDDIQAKAAKMINSISDSSWINELGVIPRTSYQARAQVTIDKLIDNIFSKIEDHVTEEFGEYLVSDSAKECLANHFGHAKIPLAELWKEQISGNPGFDFHSESPSDILCFGEAKYKSSQTPHTIAIGQIVRFIREEKDVRELVDLANFARNESIDNAINNQKGFVAAFSLVGQRFDQIFSTALNSDLIDPLLNYPELYLIGVEI